MSCFILQITGTNPEIDWLTLPFTIDVDEESSPVMDKGENDLFKSEYIDEHIYNVSLPANDRNYSAIGSLLSGANANTKRKEINVAAFFNGEIMNIDKMFVIKNESHSESKRIDVQLFNSKSWAKLASEKLLTSIDVVGAPIFHTRGFIDSANSSGAEYIDDGFTFRYPVKRRREQFEYTTNFIGTKQTDKPFTESDFEPFVYALPLLRKGFQDIGFSFESEFLESPMGRRILTYILADDYNDLFKVIPLKVTGGVNWIRDEQFIHNFEDVFLFSTILRKNRDIDTDVDPVENEHWSFGQYKESVICDFTLDLKLKSAVRLSESDQSYHGDVRIRVMSGSEVILEYDEYLTPTVPEVTVSLNLPEVEVGQQKPLSVQVGIKPDRPGRENWLKCYDYSLIATKVYKRVLSVGDYYQLNDLFQPKDTLMDYLKGIAHLIWGKVTVDYSTRKIILHTPYDSWGDFGEGTYNFNGFFTSTMIKIDKIVKNSLTIEQEDKDYTRYAKINFQDSKEEFVNKLYASTGREIDKFSLYGLFLDWGEEYKTGVETFQNSYFTVTYNSDQYLYPLINYGGEYTEIGRRILFAYGQKDVSKNAVIDNGVEISPEKDIKFKFWNKQNSVINPFWAWQSIIEENVTLQDEEFFHLAFKPYNKTKDYVNVFGNLWDAFVKRYAKILFTSQKGQISKFFTQTEFHLFDGRAQYFLEYKDIAVAVRILKISDYRPCDKSGAVITFVIDDLNKIEPVVTDVPPNSLIPSVETDFYITVDKVECTYFIGYQLDSSDIVDA